MRLIIILLFLLSVLILAACNQTGSTVFDINDSDNSEEKVATETVEPLNCDDGNSCTEDKFNAETNKCDYNPVKNCCGNNMCETNEGCNSATQKTECEKDCGLRCVGKLVVTGPVCEG